jgi:hypothetical protein
MVIRATACLMGMACIWAVSAVWMSAHLVISVFAELASYWLVLFTVLGAGYIFLRGQSHRVTRFGFLCNCLLTGFALLVVLVSWRWSDDRFALYKIGSISPGAWSQMALDLGTLGREIAQSGANSLPSGKAPPVSLQQLGSEVDFGGTFGAVINSADYSGVTAGILFGYKGRSWGLCVGPQSFAKKYSRNVGCIPVATNAFFFAGPRD